MTTQTQAALQILDRADRQMKMFAVNVIMLRERRNEYFNAKNDAKAIQARDEHREIEAIAMARGEEYHDRFVLTMKAYKFLNAVNPDWHSVLGSI
jgi:hypothetical protein